MRRFNLKHIISECHQISDSLHFKILGALQKCSDLPLLVLSRKFLFEPGPGGNDLYVLPKDLGSEGHEPLGAELDPTFCGVGDDQGCAACLG